MARNSTLADVTEMFKTETGLSLDTGVGAKEIERVHGLIDSQQKWLASEYDWPFLKEEDDVAIVPGIAEANRYYTLPTVLNFERPVSVSILFNTYWHPVDFGIGPDEYNAFSSGDGSVPAIQADPIMRWAWKPGDETKIEVWPLPLTAQTLRFSGQRSLTSLKSGATYNTAATLDLDDLLVVLFAGARYTARDRKEDSKIMLAMAEQRLNRIRASYPSKRDIVLGGSIVPPRRKVVPIIATA